CCNSVLSWARTGVGAIRRATIAPTEVNPRAQYLFRERVKCLLVNIQQLLQSLSHGARRIRLTEICRPQSLRAAGRFRFAVAADDDHGEFGQAGLGAHALDEFKTVDARK